MRWVCVCVLARGHMQNMHEYLPWEEKLAAAKHWNFFFYLSILSQRPTFMPLYVISFYLFIFF